jgi:hypothetical protein
MAYQTLTADGSVTFTCKQGARLYGIVADDTFGGGTVAFFVKVGGGTNNAILDSAGSPVTATSAKRFTHCIVGGDSTRSDELTQMVATLTGATNPNLKIHFNSTV